MGIRFAALCLMLAGSALSFSQQPAASDATAANLTIPRLIRFSGQLKNGAGTVGITFTLHKTQQDEAALWTESQNVKVDETGKYTVLLGSTKTDGMPVDLFASGEAQWLGIHIQGQPDQRVLLVSVPYAMKAAEAETLAGHAATDFVTSDKVTDLVLQQFQQRESAANAPAAVNGAVIANSTPAMAGATNFTDSTTNQVVAVTQTNTGSALTATASNTALIATSSTTSGTASGVQGHSYSTSGVGVYGYSHAASGTTYGVEGNATSPSGVGVYGYNASPTGYSIGVVGQTQSVNGTGVEGYATSPSGTTKGIFAAVSSPSGTAEILQNNGGGKLISGQSGTSHTEVFSVSGSGDVAGAGKMTGTQLVSTVANGTPPLTVNSQSMVSGLNAELFAGAAVSSFPQLALANSFSALQTFNVGATVNTQLSVHGGSTGPAETVTAGSGQQGINASGGASASAAGSSAVYVNGGSGLSGGAGISGFGGVGSTGFGGPGASFTGGQSASSTGGDGVDGVGADNTSAGSPGAGVSGTGGSTTGPANLAGPGVVGYGGMASLSGGIGGYGGYLRGGNSVASSGQNYGGYGLYVIGGNATNGSGGTAIVATGGSGNNPGDAADLYGSVTIADSDAKTVIGDPGCGAGWIGVLFGNFSDGLSGCSNYNIAGDGTDMLLNVISGGAIRFRQANVDTMYINSSGNVVIGGNLAVNGAITAGTKDFVIDHPLDPQNKLLYHTSIESPDMKTLYDGVVKLDARGEAWVALPDYFEALNGDFRYMLTPIGRSAPYLHVAHKIADNRFKISGGKPHMEVSWQITGIRHDAFANANRGPIEVEKTVADKGKYLHPEAFAASIGQNHAAKSSPAGER